jgi:hypothetical protein
MMRFAQPSHEVRAKPRTLTMGRRAARAES